MRLPKLAVGLLLVCAPVEARPKGQPPSEVLATIDGIPVRRKDVINRLWSRHANEALNQIIDELVVNKALSAWRVRQDQKERQSVLDEVDARLKKIKSQFKDDAAFSQSLQKSGTVLAALETQLREQIERERLIVSAKKLSVSPAEVKTAFEANKGKLGGPPALRLRHLVVPTEQQAKDLLVAVRVGADFAKLAGELSLDAGTRDKGGDLGFVTEAIVDSEFQKQILGLAPGQVSEVIRMSDGFHLFKAEERREPKDPPFDEVQKDLAAALLAQKVSQAWPSYVAELRASTKIVPAAGVTMTSPPAGAGAN